MAVKAARNYNQGEVILKSKPFAHVVNADFKKQRCDWCFSAIKEAKKALPCGACKVNIYCNPDCMQADNDAGHLLECKYYAKSERDVAKMTSIERILLRTLVKIRHKPDLATTKHEVPFAKGAPARSFADLMSHTEDIGRDVMKMAEFEETLNNINNWTELNFDRDESFKIFGQLCTNGFTITNDIDDVEVGMGLYIQASVFDHSCEAPRCDRVFDGNDMVIRAIKPIDAGDELYLPYISLTVSRDQRQKILESQYYFTCSCGRCDPGAGKQDPDRRFNLTEINRIKGEYKRYEKTILFEKKPQEKTFVSAGKVLARTLPLIEPILGEFHPRVSLNTLHSLQLMLCFYPYPGLDERLTTDDKKLVSQLYGKVNERLPISHGTDHSLYEYYKKWLMDIDYPLTASTS